MKNKLIKFRIWHKTRLGIGFQDLKAKDKESIKIPKWIKDNLIEIEQLEN